MDATTVKFAFDATVPIAEVEATLRLAVMAVESIYGEERVRLEGRVAIDHDERSCVIESETDVGRSIALVFSGYIRREFGEAAVQITTGKSASLVLGGVA